MGNYSKVTPTPNNCSYPYDYYKRYCIIDQQKAWYFVQYSEILSNPTSLLCNLYN